MKIKKSFTADFDFGDEVSLRTDVNEDRRVVTGIILRPGGKLYELACGLEYSCHQSVEIIQYPPVPKVKGFQNGNGNKK